MSKGIEWIYFIYINIAFLILNLTILFFGSIAEIKKNWSLYKCNPAYFPLYPILSDNVEEDFTGCLQNITFNFNLLFVIGRSRE